MGFFLWIRGFFNLKKKMFPLFSTLLFAIDPLGISITKLSPYSLPENLSLTSCFIRVLSRFTPAKTALTLYGYIPHRVIFDTLEIRE